MPWRTGLGKLRRSEALLVKVGFGPGPAMLDATGPAGAPPRNSIEPRKAKLCRPPDPAALDPEFTSVLRTPDPVTVYPVLSAILWPPNPPVLYPKFTRHFRTVNESILDPKFAAMPHASISSANGVAS